jgi:hypothetical protein
VPAGGRIRSAPGRLGHHACRHYDRRAGCFAETGTGRRVTPAANGFEIAAASREAWPEAEPKATRVPSVRAAVERRKACAPCKARAASKDAEVENAPTGVPLPFFFRHCERKRSNPALYRAALDCFVASAPRNDGRKSVAPVTLARKRGAGTETLALSSVQERGRTVGERQKITPEQYKARFAAEKILQERRYCNVFKLWRTCRLKSCRRNEACGGNQHACLKRALDRVPRLVQWQARQDILTATPRNVGGPERAARQCMPRDFYE